MRRSIVPWACGLLLIVGILLPAGRAQSRAESLEDRVTALEKEVQSLREQMQRLQQGAPAAAGEPASIPIAGAAARGSEDAKLVLVEFSDYQCPFCGRYARDTYPQIDEAYVRTGRIQYVFKNFPIEQIHPQAMKAAQSAECAGRQGKYWPMHDRLFANQEALDEASLLKYAAALGLKMAEFMACLEGETEAQVRQDLTDGRNAGADATPTFFVGTRQPDGTLKVLRRLVGAMPYPSFRAALDDLLKRAAAQN